MTTDSPIGKVDELLFPSVGPQPLFECENGYLTYTKATNKEKCTILKNQAKVVSMTPNDEYLRDEQKKFLEKIEANELFNGEKWTNKHFMTEIDVENNSKFLAEKYFLARHVNNGLQKLAADKNKKKNNNRANGNATPLVIGQPQAFLNQYEPPANRILITKNITFNELNPIPVYCDIGKELEELVIPETLAFNYIDANFVNKKLEPDLVKAIKMAEQKKNHIKCDCASKRILCYENENCPCFKMNKDLQSLREDNATGPSSEFRSLHPIRISFPQNIFYGNVGFACSDACSCQGKCDNNSLLIPQNFIFPLEIFRKDEIVGFMVRSPVFIPIGTPVMEFTGEYSSNVILPNAVAYSLRCTYSDDDAFREFYNSKLGYTGEYKKLLNRLYKEEEIHINPIDYGNVARMISHSCCPNLEVLRVYRKSLSPAHLSFIMVTIEDVYPGTPFSFDYGPSYAVTDGVKLMHVCKCKMFSCQGKDNDSKESKEMGVQEMSEVIREINELRVTSYKTLNGDE